MPRTLRQITGFNRAVVKTDLIWSLMSAFLVCAIIGAPAHAQPADPDVGPPAGLFAGPPESVTPKAHGRAAIEGDFDSAPLARGARRLRMQLPDGSVVDLEQDGLEQRGPGNLAWRGRVADDDDSRVSLTLRHGLVFGRVRIGEDVYEIRTGRGNKLTVEELDIGSFPGCSVGAEHAVTGDPADDTVADTDSEIAREIAGSVVVDLLSVYSNDALAAVGGGAAQMEATIQAAVDAANTAFIDSNVDAYYRLVHVEHVNHDTLGSTGSDLSWVRNDPQVAALRDQYGADMVSVIVDTPSSCGTAYVQRSPGPGFEDLAFQATDIDCAVGNLTFAHEHGHNLGMEHNPENSSASSSTASYPWSFAHYVNGSYRTVMSYSAPCANGCTRVTHFSNPDVLHNGVPTGIANSRDNAQTADLTTPIVADFRSTVVPEANPYANVNEIMTWVPSYALTQSRAMATANFGTCSPKDVITRVGLQFWQVQSNGSIIYDPLYNPGPDDAEVAWWRNWCTDNGVQCMMTPYNHDGTDWNWAMAKSAFDNNRATHVAALISELERLDLDGIDIDYEGIGDFTTDRAAFAQFLDDLSVELKARGKVLTVNSFHYIWNGPNQDWWPDWVGVVDNIHSMGYQDLYEGGTSYQPYSFQQDVGVTAGFAGNDVTMGFPSWVSSWGTSSGRGTNAQAHVQEVRHDLPYGPTGIAIWDFQMQGADWQTSNLWCEIADLGADGGGNALSVGISTGSDDVEQNVSSGAMTITSTDLELGLEGTTPKAVGLLFRGLNIPQGAVIDSAYLEFQTDETGSGQTDVTIRAEDIDNAPSFASSGYNVTDRTLTTAFAAWNVPAWNYTGVRHQSPDLSTVVQEVIDRSGWSLGNSMAFVITGTGTRTAEAYEGTATGAPHLHVTFSVGGGNSGDTTPPTPSPMDWATQPFMDPTWPDDNVATMTALTASDPSGGIEYFFDCVEAPTGSWWNGCEDSGWQSGATFSDWFLVDNTTYHYRVKARDMHGNETAWSAQATLVVGGNSPPTASFTHVTDDLAVAFTDSSTDADNNITTWSWTFGDGNGSSQQHPSHTYASGGTYTVNLTVTDSDGASDSTSQSVTVSLPDTTPPTFQSMPADIVTEATAPMTPVDIGTPVVTDDTDPNPSVSANDTGPFPVGITPVTWTATDSSGNSSQAIQNVTITDSTAPTIVAPADIETVATGEFTSVNLGTPTVSDIADPVPSAAADNTGPFPVGTTTVTWTAIDASGNQSTDTQQVTITPAPIVHVGDLDVSKTGRKNWTATVSILVHGLDESPISGITVSGGWTGGSTNGDSCVTQSDGRCTVSQQTKGDNLTFTVDGLSGSGVTYDAAANHDPDGESTGTAITINKDGTVPGPNLPPAFTSDPVDGGSVGAGQAYSGSIASDASDPNGDPLTFSKVSGPTWLTVAGNGSLGGTAPATQGLQSFVVAVADSEGLSDTATLEIQVTEPVAATQVHLAGLTGSATTGRGQRWNAIATVTVHKSGDVAVGGVTVSGSWSGDASGGGSCTSGGDGTCAITRSNIKGGSVATFTVTGMTGNNIEYAPGNNTAPSTSVSINRP